MATVSIVAPHSVPRGTVAFSVALLLVGGAGGVGALPATTATTAAAVPASCPGAMDYRPRPLSAVELAVVSEDFAAGVQVESDRRIIPEQSFVLTMPAGWELMLIASESQVDNIDRLHFDWKSPTSEGGYFPLPADPTISTNWTFWELKAVSFGDFDGDGLGPDVIAIAEYTTGAGPTGAQPFPAATVYFLKAPYTTTTDAALNRALQERGVGTIDGAKAEIAAFCQRQPPSSEGAL